MEEEEEVEEKTKIIITITIQYNNDTNKNKSRSYEPEDYTPISRTVSSDAVPGRPSLCSSLALCEEMCFPLGELLALLSALFCVTEQWSARTHTHSER